MPRKPGYDRNDLINRARDLFWRRGWAGTSLKDLEAELQMKPGSFYAAFGSKDALYGLALDQYATDGAARLRALADEHGPLAALRRFPEQVLKNPSAPARACMLSRTLLELQAHDHPLADRASDHLRSMEDQFADLFAQAQAQGDIDPTLDPKKLARKYQSDLMGLRVTAERRDVDAMALASEFAEGVGRA